MLLQFDFISKRKPSIWARKLNSTVFSFKYFKMPMLMCSTFTWQIFKTKRLCSMLTSILSKIIMAFDCYYMVILNVCCQYSIKCTRLMFTRKLMWKLHRHCQLIVLCGWEKKVNYESVVNRNKSSHFIYMETCLSYSSTDIFS